MPNAITPVVEPTSTAGEPFLSRLSAASSYTYNSGTDLAPVAGRGYVLVVASGCLTAEPNVPTITTTTGLVFEVVDSIAESSDPIRKLTVLRSQKAAGLVPGNLIIDFAGQQQTFCQAVLMRAPGAVQTGTNGADMVARSLALDTNNIGASTFTGKVVADAAAGVLLPNNIVVLATMLSKSGSVTRDAAGGWLELAAGTLQSGKNATLAVHWNDGAKTSEAMSALDVLGASMTPKWATIAVEVAAASQPSAPTGTGITTTALSAPFVDSGAKTVYTWTLPTAPTAGRGYLLLTSHGDNAGAPPSPTLTTTTGLVFVLVGERTFSNTPGERIGIYRALKASGVTGGNIVFTFSRAQTGLVASLIEATGVLTTGTDGANMIRQAVAATNAEANAQPSLTLAVPDLGNAANRVVAAVTIQEDGFARSTAPANAVELVDAALAAGKNVMQAAWATVDTSLAITMRAQEDDLSDVTKKMSGFAIELVAATTATTTDKTDSDTVGVVDGDIGDFAADATSFDTIAVFDDAEAPEVLSSPPPPPESDPGSIPSSSGRNIALDVYVRDAAGRIVGMVDRERMLGLALELNHQDANTWLLDVDLSSRIAPLLLEPGAGIVVVREAIVELSGDVWRRNRSRRAVDGGFINVLEVSGEDDTSTLKARMAYPDPALLGPPFTTQEYDVRTGPAESIMYDFVDVNAGPAAPADRRIANLVLGVDLGRGDTGAGGGGGDFDVAVTSERTGRGRFQSIHDLLREIAEATRDNLGWRITQTLTGPEKLFEVYEPADRSKTARFAEDIGNLAGFEYEEERPEATVVIAAGKGEGTARMFATATNGAAFERWGRIEAFVDARDVDDADELQRRAEEKLAAMGSKTKLAIEPRDTAALAYGVDYRVGDLVTVVADGEQIVDVVRSVRLVYGAGGEVISPQVGSDPISSTVRSMMDRLRSLSRQVEDLQRR